MQQEVNTSDKLIDDGRFLPAETRGGGYGGER
jgi:hypothetical protein